MPQGRMARSLFIVAVASLAVVALGCLVWWLNERSKPQPTLLQYELRCGLSKDATLALARKAGYRECSVPTAKGDVPDYGCSARGRWVAFWFEGDSLRSYMFGDSYAEECASGCSSERLDLCSRPFGAPAS